MHYSARVGISPYFSEKLELLLERVDLYQNNWMLNYRNNSIIRIKNPPLYISQRYILLNFSNKGFAQLLLVKSLRNIAKTGKLIKSSLEDSLEGGLKDGKHHEINYSDANQCESQRPIPRVDPCRQNKKSR